MDLLTIGAFARLTRLSPKALRRYDRVNLLAPAHVDPASGYRWYTPDQADRARLVALLRQLDLPLARIAELVDLPRDEQAAALAKYWSDQEERMRARRQLAGFLIDELTGNTPAMREVLIRDVPARTLLTITETLTAADVGAFAGPLFGQFWRTGRPFLRYHAEVTNDTEGPVEFCCPTTENASHPDMIRKSEPASREAALGVTKSEMMTSLAFEQLRNWCAATGTGPAGPPRQIFLANPDDAGIDDIVFELAIPVANA
ncbi:MAG TPA: MerR family transcriptional regulator [Pseudonocardiaceae bacterium]|jgi:DNA-binding transcriptional MerR regulator